MKRLSGHAALRAYTGKRNLISGLFAYFAIASTSLGGAGAMAQDTAANLEVRTRSGPLAGTRIGRLEAWLAIPYARPPIGSLRWRPPAPARPWSVVRQADKPPSSCAQNADLLMFAAAGGSEDCLYLNVYRPVNATAAVGKLPVFVWFHGGAMKVGQSVDYDPSKLAERGQAIVVTLNYRLGVLGFFSHPAIDGKRSDIANYGLMDQQAALRWVRDNIGAFGGDPGRVTIAGESSGGNSALLHLASPGSAALFHRVIAMSGANLMVRYPGPGAVWPLAVVRDRGVRFAKAVGCEQDTERCLRALPIEQILKAQGPFALNEGVIGGDVLPIGPADAFPAGKFNRVPVISGNTRDEGRFFSALAELRMKKVMSPADYEAAIGAKYGARIAPAVLHEYPLDDYDSAAEALAAATTDLQFACAGLELNRALSRWVQVRAYEFADATAPGYLPPISFPLRSAHTYELSYLFPRFHGAAESITSLNPMQERLSDQMIDLFMNPAEPSQGVIWAPFDAEKENLLSFSLPQAREVFGRTSKLHHCRFWQVQGLF